MIESIAIIIIKMAKHRVPLTKFKSFKLFLILLFCQISILFFL